MRRVAFLFLLALIPLFGFGMGGARLPSACARIPPAGDHRAPCCPQPANDCCRYSQPYAAIAATAVEPTQRSAVAFAILVPATSPFFSVDDHAAPARPALYPPPLPRTPLILPLRV